MSNAETTHDCARPNNRTGTPMNDSALDHLLRFYLSVTAHRDRDERGDVPGWVMVTVMTVALAIAIFGFARDPLEAMLQRAFDSVK